MHSDSTSLARSSSLSTSDLFNKRKKRAHLLPSYLNSRLSSVSSLLSAKVGSSILSSATWLSYNFDSTNSTPKEPKTVLNGNKVAICTSNDLALQESLFCFSPARRAARRCLRVCLTPSAIQVEKNDLGVSMTESPESTSLYKNNFDLSQKATN